MADEPLTTDVERKVYFNEHAKPLFGTTWAISGPNGRLAATGDIGNVIGMYERFCAWLDSDEAKLPPRTVGMG